MSTIAVIGATGTAGSLVTNKLKSQDVTVVEISRSHGVDLISGQGLSEALQGVDVAIDASNVVPDDNADIVAVHSTAARNLAAACFVAEVGRLVVLTIAGIDRPEFDDVPFCVAKRRQREIVLHSGVPTTIVKSTHWHEFAANPAAVTFSPTEVAVQDWLIQPIAADTVAEVLLVAAMGAHTGPRTITGPDVIRLPELTSKMLDAQGDHRRVRTVQPPLAALADGALLAPRHAVAIGPTIDTWLEAIKALAWRSRSRSQSRDSHIGKETRG
jgi:uncharacterized protein YbjT (DUF2867 family)